MIERGDEDYVAKDEASVYEGGPTRRWLKVKQKVWTVEEDRWRPDQCRVAGSLSFVIVLPHCSPSRTPARCGGLSTVSLLTELDAYHRDHRLCGELDAADDDGPRRG